MTLGWAIFSALFSLLSFLVGYAAGRMPNHEDLYDDVDDRSR